MVSLNESGQLSGKVEGKTAIETRQKWRRRYFPYLLVLPAALAILLVQVGPMLVGVAMSFLRLTQFTIGNWVAAPFAGLSNFHLAVNLNEPIARALLHSFAITCAFTVVVVGVSWVFGTAGAVFVTDSFKGRNLLRSLFILPYAIPGYIGVVIWLFMFLPQGAVNTLLANDLHIVAPSTFWLGGSRAFLVIAVTSIWATWPFAFLLMLAGVQGVPPELYEAARVDGATRWSELRLITLPSVRRVSLLLILVTGFYSFNNFTTPYILFGTSAPASASLLSLQIYVNSFVELNFGLGAAMSVLMIAFLIILTAVYMRMLHFNVGASANA